MTTIIGLDFGDVVKGLAQGRRFGRVAWQGHRLIYREDGSSEIYVCNDVQKVRVRVWAPSPMDLTATDWIEVVS